MSITRTTTQRATNAEVNSITVIDPDLHEYIDSYPGKVTVRRVEDAGLTIVTISTFESQAIMDQFDSDEIVILVKQQTAQYCNDNGISLEIQVVNNSNEEN